ncbi:hypothetical protein NNJEOMEG_02540 [Fundidesulfovibrio magnetotacticus]|uniref:NIF system FeS cluster assembly NifU N-terminal domain-containing protein n=1 Tax=Fundidesulfovibrio magnetotacticus TaxID=2730080 RepID=A0A6V8LQ98_9BACT|nr:iron-sulfur cluster assembly scaffold protein [Fundidesulfovibrio magnetotacticus]GFK94693.1 hypothetical protein NNJEOMEG_02540 [Fundidesulfovibrio magnetotacticus]
MQLTLSVTGRRCDLALHPISPCTARNIEDLGRKFYTKKYIHWWRGGRTSTCGMLLDDDCRAQAVVGQSQVPVDLSGAAANASHLRRERYLSSRARHLALLGYDDEHCRATWTWHGVETFDPAKLRVTAHRWDRVTGQPDYVVLERVLYDGRCADVEDYHGSTGFTLVDPRVIDLEELRRHEARDQGKLRDLPRDAFPGRSRPDVPAACVVSGRSLLLPVPRSDAEGVSRGGGGSIAVRLRIQGDVVVQAGGEAHGCEYCRRSLEALAEMATGLTVHECFMLSDEDLLPFLPRVHAHLDCSSRAMDALRAAVRDWERRRAA